MRGFISRYANWIVAAAVGLLIAFLFVYAPPAKAADLGGNCCADLEERIAELEGTVVRKGNRKVSLVLSGAINKALFYHDADDFGLGSDTSVIENGAAESYLSISGAGQIRPGLWAGYNLEIVQGQTGIGISPGFIGVTTDNDLYTRQSYAFIKSDDLGALSVGLQSMATDDLSQQSVARTWISSKRLTWQPIGGLLITAPGIDLNVPLEPFNGKKANSVKYTSRTIEGFVASAAWNSEDDSWDASLRYAGKGGGLEYVAAVGYYDDKNNDIAESVGSLVAIPDIESKTLSANAGVKHTASGLFAQGTWARLEVDLPALLGGASFETDSYHVQVGIETKFFAVGQSTLFGEYSDWSDLGLKFYGAGFNQSLTEGVDAYVLARRYELDVGAGGNIDTVLGGIRVGF